MTFDNCNLCGKIHRINPHNPDLCSDCLTKHEAEYEDVLERIEKLIKDMALEDAWIKKVGHDPQRVKVALSYRFCEFSKKIDYIPLDEHRKEHCYICESRIFINLGEDICIDCLQNVLKILECWFQNRESSRNTRNYSLNFVAKSARQIKTNELLRFSYKTLSDIAKPITFDDSSVYPT
jgi:hypothetical protein